MSSAEALNKIKAAHSALMTVLDDVTVQTRLDSYQRLVIQGLDDELRELHREIREEMEAAAA